MGRPPMGRGIVLGKLVGLRHILDPEFEGELAKMSPDDQYMAIVVRLKARQERTQPAHLELLSVPEAAEILAIKPTECWKLIRAGELQTVKFARRKYVSVDELRRYLRAHGDVIERLKPVWDAALRRY